MTSHDHCQCDYCSGEDCLPFVEDRDKRDAAVKELIHDALTTDGGHHKQWYLEQIAEKLGIDISGIDYDKGLPP